MGATLANSNKIRYPAEIEDAIQAASKKHGVDANALRAVMELESKGNPNAKNPKSSASGLFQFIDSTAKVYGLTDKFNAHKSADAGARLMKDNMKGLEKSLGRAPTVGELYLAHQQGLAGAKKLISDPNAKASSVVGSKAVSLNGGTADMTAGEFANLWMDKAQKALPLVSITPPGSYFNDLAPDLMAYTKPKPNPDFQPVPTPKTRTAAIDGMLSAPATPVQTAALQPLLSAQPDAPAQNIQVASNDKSLQGLFDQTPDSVYMHDPNVSDEENITRGIMQAIQRGNPNIPKPRTMPDAGQQNIPNGLFQDPTSIPSHAAEYPSNSSIFMSNRTAGLPTQQSSQPALNVENGFDGRLSEINAHHKNVSPTPDGRSLPSWQRGLMPSSPTSRPTQQSSEPWAMPADIQNASYRAREALGAGNGSTPSPMSKPASTPDYSGYGQRSSAENIPNNEPQFINKTISQQVPKTPAGGMSLDQASQFAYGPSSINFNQANAAPPIPTAKPAPEYDTVTKQIQVANPNYQPTPMAQPQPIAPPIPTAKPQQGLLSQLGGALGGMFNPAGTAGGLIGGALGGPLGSLAGNFAGRGISNVIRNNPTVGNRGTNNSLGTGSNSGGPYQGQSWRNTTNQAGRSGTKTFNPSTRQYEIAGVRTDNQRTGSSSGGGGFFSSIFG